MAHHSFAESLCYQLQYSYDCFLCHFDLFLNYRVLEYWFLFVTHPSRCLHPRCRLMPIVYGKCIFSSDYLDLTEWIMAIRWDYSYSKTCMRGYFNLSGSRIIYTKKVVTLANVKASTRIISEGSFSLNFGWVKISRFSNTQMLLIFVFFWNNRSSGTFISAIEVTVLIKKYVARITASSRYDNSNTETLNIEP